MMMIIRLVEDDEVKIMIKLVEGNCMTSFSFTMSCDCQMTESLFHNQLLLDTSSLVVVY